MTAADGKSFSYDSQNELVSMNGGAVQIMYDGDGNRVAKSVNGVVTRYLVNDLNPTGSVAATPLDFDSLRLLEEVRFSVNRLK